MHSPKKSPTPAKKTTIKGTAKPDAKKAAKTKTTTPPASGAPHATAPPNSAPPADSTLDSATALAKLKQMHAELTAKRALKPLSTKETRRRTRYVKATSLIDKAEEEAETAKKKHRDEDLEDDAAETLEDDPDLDALIATVEQDVNPPTDASKTKGPGTDTVTVTKEDRCGRMVIIRNLKTGKTKDVYILDASMQDYPIGGCLP